MRPEALFTSAVSTDAAVVTYGETSASKLLNAVAAAALLAATTQAESPRLSDRIILSVVCKERVFIAVAPLQIKIDVIPSASRRDLRHRKTSRLSKHCPTRRST